MTATHEDPSVRAAVLASITPQEARWLAQHSDLVIRYCADEILQTAAADFPDVVDDFRQGARIESPTEAAPFRGVL